MSAASSTASSEDPPLPATETSARPSSSSRVVSGVNSVFLQPTESPGYTYLLLMRVCFAAYTTLLCILESRYDVPIPPNLYQHLFYEVSEALRFIFTFHSQYTEQEAGQVSTVTRRQVKLLPARVCACVGSAFLLFSSMQHIHFRDAAAFFCTSPVLTFALSYGIRRDSISLADVISVVISAFGARFISWRSDLKHATRNNSGASPKEGRNLALLSAFWAACGFATIRKVGANVNFIVSTTVLLFARLYVGPSYMYFSSVRRKEMYKLDSFLKITLKGIAFVGSHTMLNIWCEECVAGRGNVIGAVAIPAAYLIGICLFGEPLNWNDSFVALILASMLCHVLPV